MSQSQADILSRSDSEDFSLSSFRLAPYLAEAHYELLATLRQPSFVVPTLLFPAMFYLFFGIIFGRSGGLASYLLPTYGAFGVISTSLFGFGVGIAVARESGELLLKRIAPVPQFAFLGAKVLTALIFSCLVLIELFGLGAILGGVRFARLEWIGLAAVLLVGTIPFAAIGLAIGTHTSGKAAPAIVNMVFLPSAFLSGLWIPIDVLPGFVRTLALALPPYHFAQLALGVVGKSAGQPVMLHIGFLVVVTVVALVFAARGFRR